MRSRPPTWKDSERKHQLRLTHPLRSRSLLLCGSVLRSYCPPRRSSFTQQICRPCLPNGSRCSFPRDRPQTLPRRHLHGSVSQGQHGRREPVHGGGPGAPLQGPLPEVREDLLAPRHPVPHAGVRHPGPCAQVHHGGHPSPLHPAGHEGGLKPLADAQGPSSPCRRPAQFIVGMRAPRVRRAHTRPPKAPLSQPCCGWIARSHTRTQILHTRATQPRACVFSYCNRTLSSSSSAAPSLAVAAAAPPFYVVQMSMSPSSTDTTGAARLA